MRATLLWTVGAWLSTSILTVDARADGDTTGAPNVLFIMSDDHTSQAVSAYGGALAQVCPTPHIDRLAKEGMLFENCFVTNSICTPSRAAIFTGKYSHRNGVYKFVEFGVQTGLEIRYVRKREHNIAEILIQNQM